MNTQRLHQLISSPMLLEINTDLPYLQQLTQDYPYFNTGHSLMAKLLYDQKNIKSSDYVKKASLYSGDRSVLYNLIQTLEMVEDEILVDLPEIEQPAEPEIEQEPAPTIQPLIPEIQPLEPNENPEIAPNQPIEPDTWQEPSTQPQTEPNQQPSPFPFGETIPNFDLDEILLGSGVETKEEIVKEELIEELIPIEVNESGKKEEEADDKGNKPTEPPQDPVNPETIPEPEHQHNPMLQPSDDEEEIDTVKNQEVNRNEDDLLAPEVNEPVNTFNQRLLPIASFDYFAFLDKSGMKLNNNVDTKIYKVGNLNKQEIKLDFYSWLQLTQTKKEWETLPSETPPEKGSGDKEQKPNLEKTPDAPPAPHKENQNEEEKSFDANDILNHFIATTPRISQTKRAIYKAEDKARESDREDTSLATETLAEIYLNQGMHAKAIEIYEKLSLRYPNKSSYFEGLIAQIKDKTSV